MSKRRTKSHESELNILYTSGFISKSEAPYTSSDSSRCHQAASSNKDELRLVLIGRTGSGKSATGNTILGGSKFPSQASASSVTRNCNTAQGLLCDHRIKLIDTPGLFDTTLESKDVTKELINCIHMSLPGPHAFILVQRIDRFTKEEIGTIESIFDIFGESMHQFTIIIFTRLDDLGTEQTLEDFIFGGNKFLKELVEKVNRRYVGFNNKENDICRVNQAKQLYDVLVSMIRGNNYTCYTNEMYKEAEQHLQEKVKEAEKAKEIEHQRQVRSIEQNFTSQIIDLKRQLDKTNSEKFMNELEFKNMVTVERERMEKELEKREMEKIRLQIMVNKLEKQKENLYKEGEQSSEHIQELNTQLAELEDERKLKTAEAVWLQSRLKDKDSSLKSKERILLECEQNRDRAVKIMSKTEEDSKKQMELFEQKLERKTKQHEADTKEFQKTKDQQEKRLKEYAAETEDTKFHIKQIELDNARKKTEVSCLRNKNTQLQKTVKRMSMDLENSELEIQELRNTMEVEKQNLRKQHIEDMRQNKYTKHNGGMEFQKTRKCCNIL